MDGALLIPFAPGIWAQVVQSHGLANRQGRSSPRDGPSKDGQVKVSVSGPPTRPAYPDSSSLRGLRLLIMAGHGDVPSSYSVRSRPAGVTASVGSPTSPREGTRFQSLLPCPVCP